MVLNGEDNLPVQEDGLLLAKVLIPMSKTDLKFVQQILLIPMMKGLYNINLYLNEKKVHHFIILMCRKQIILPKNSLITAFSALAFTKHLNGLWKRNESIKVHYNVWLFMSTMHCNRYDK